MGEWSNGLFGCFSDIKTCLLTWMCPCIGFGLVAEKLGESCVLYALALYVPLLNFYCMTMVRGKVREAKGIDGSCVSDLLTMCFCGICALIQEVNEMDAGTILDMKRS